MSQAGKLPRPGEFYRYGENKLCQVAAVAEHAGNGEKLVICQELFGAYRVVAWPAGDFWQRAGNQEYPDLEHKDCSGEAGPAENEPALNPDLMAFFEAMDKKDYDAMIASLDKLSGRITDKELEDIYLVMDLKHADGDPVSQVASIRKQILMLKKFDGVRLR